MMEKQDKCKMKPSKIAWAFLIFKKNDSITIKYSNNILIIKLYKSNKII